MKNLTRTMLVLATLAGAPFEQAHAAGVLTTCGRILRDYVGLPALAGASEALGGYVFGLLVEKQEEAGSEPVVASLEAVAPPTEITSDYINYLLSQGLSECEVRLALERVLGPPRVKRYNPD